MNALVVSEVIEEFAYNFCKVLPIFLNIVCDMLHHSFNIFPTFLSVQYRDLFKGFACVHVFINSNLFRITILC